MAKKSIGEKYQWQKITMTIRINTNKYKCKKIPMANNKNINVVYNKKTIAQNMNCVIYVTRYRQN